MSEAAVADPPRSLPDGRPWPRISVVTPALGSERHLEENILSVLNQHYPRVEHIIIGPHDQEEVPGPVAAHRDAVGYAVCEASDGSGGAIGHGMGMARGEILTWLRGDDYLAPGALHALALGQAQSGADVIAGACQLHRDGERDQQHLTAYARGRLRLEELLDFESFWLPSPFLYQPGMAFTREIWRRAGSRVAGLDGSGTAYELWLRFAEHGAGLHVVGHPIVWCGIDDAEPAASRGRDRAALSEVRDAFLRRHRYPAKEPSPQATTPRQRWVLVNDRAFQYGAGIAHRRIARVLERAGHEVHVVATERMDASGSTSAFVNEVMDRIGCHRPDVVLVGNLHGAAHATDVLEGICRRFETIVMLHDFWMLTGGCIYPGAMRRHLEGCDERCDCPYEASDSNATSVRDAWERKRGCLRGAERLSLVAPSEWMSERVREALAVPGDASGPGGPGCHWLKLAIELEEFIPRDRALCRELLGLPRDRFILLTSADSLSDPRKGLDHLASALDRLQLRDVLVVAPGWYGSQEELPIPGMRALGYVDDPARLALVFAAADLFVGPSLDEAFGQVFVEAAACGTPSIGYPIGGVPEALVHGVTGLLAADVGPRHLAERIDELYHDPERRSELGRWARMHVENEWSAPAAYHQLLQALRSAGVAQRTGLAPRISLQPDSRQTPERVRTLVSPSVPLVFDLPTDAYRRYPVFGSATRTQGGLTLDVVLSIERTTSADRDASNGLYFGNDERGFALVYQHEHWSLLGYSEGEIALEKPLWRGLRERNEFSIRIAEEGRHVSVSLPDGTTESQQLGDTLFEGSDTAYLHVQTAPGAKVELLEASVRTGADVVFDETLAGNPPLRELATAHGLTIGTLPDGGWYGSVLDHQLLTRHANLLVWHLDWDDFVNRVTSTRLSFARAHGMRVRAHPLVWREQFPSWLENGAFSRNQLAGILRERIASLMTRHVVDEWVVVNEAVADDGANGGFIDDVLYRTFGLEYVDMAFFEAHSADPQAVLLYNDFDIETPGPKADRVYDLLRGMLRRQVPVHGLGMQFHLLTSTAELPTKEEILAGMARFADLGLSLYVTELEVNLLHLTGSRQEKWAVQARLYRDVVESCLESGICKSVTTWGFNDRASWLYDQPGGGEDPLLFDRQGRAKPAFTAIQQVLSGR